jgi:hypothetical protein
MFEEHQIAARIAFVQRASQRGYGGFRRFEQIDRHAAVGRLRAREHREAIWLFVIFNAPDLKRVNPAL